jgi:hypothetical protein
MLPQEDLALEVDPDPGLEREAEETAERVVSGGELNIRRMQEAVILVQRTPQTELSEFFDGIPERSSPPQVDEELEKEHPVDIRERGRIPPDVGRDITGTIRAALNQFDDQNLKDRNNRNVAYAVVFTDERSFSIVAISGDSGYGYAVPFEEDQQERELEADFPQLSYHTESKVLNAIVQEVEESTDGEVYLFTERAPCPSCANVIEQFDDHEQIDLELVVTYDPEVEGAE